MMRVVSRLLVIVFAQLLLCQVPVYAQGLQLSPAQQQMLNALPASQRQQALAAIRQLQEQQSAGTTETINEALSDGAPPIDSAAFDQIVDAAELVAEPRSRIVINFTLRDSITSKEKQAFESDPVLSGLNGSHFFTLDESGILSLQGLELIPLLGLSEIDINRRLSTEPFLSIFEVDARILKQKPIGLEALQPFGYDVFSPTQSELNSVTSGPVPSDYVLGPGDTVRLQLFGNVNTVVENEVSREGVLNLPEIGPVNAAGLSFEAFRADVSNRVENMLIGTQVSVSMGQLRTIRVFVLGEVNQPGSYVVSGLSTMSSALYSGGGVSEIGSLRNIYLKRNGQVVATLDAYDLLLRGDNSGDRRLRPGDVVFVPPVGKVVSVGGAVRRPAIYEVKRLTTAADLMALAGGLSPDAFAEGARLERIEENGERTVLAVDLLDASANSIRINSGDTLLVPQVLPELSNVVNLQGHVHRPGSYPWRDGMRLSDLLPSSDELKSGVDLDYILIRRESERGQPLEVLSTSLSEALSAIGSASDIPLQSRDTVYVFSTALGRQRIVTPLLEELELHSSVDRPSPRVQIAGNVRAPGDYPLERGMRISDLIRAGGNLSENAFALEAELTSYEIMDDGSRQPSVRVVDLAAIRREDLAADTVLREHDYLRINRIPDWDSVWTVTIEGEVVFPGEYRVQRGETLHEVLERAGGLTEAAFAEGAVFLRESLRSREQEQIETLARRMEADLAALSLQSLDGSGSETLSTGNVLLEQLRNTEAVGRLVIDLEDIKNGNRTSLEMRDGDRLLVPTTTQVVTVLGESQQNTSHMYEANRSRDDYIDLSGGLTRRADKKLIYVVRANGAVIAGNRSKWFGRKQGINIRPGDTIVIPLDTDRMRPLTFWGNVTQILYQGAIAVAAVRTFNN